MSRRQEIKQKEELQARFQLAIANNNKKVLNWLKPHKSSTDEINTTTTSTTNEQDDSFLNLQIIPLGSSLNMKTTENIQKIGEFLTSKDISKSKQLAQQDNLKKHGGSKPMLALMNRMRDSNRKNIQKTANKKNIRQNKKLETNKQPTEVNDDDEEEDEDERDSRDIRSRTAKKGSSLLLEQKLNNNKGKKKGIRPF